MVQQMNIIRSYIAKAREANRSEPVFFCRIVNICDEFLDVLHRAKELARLELLTDGQINI